MDRRSCTGWITITLLVVACAPADDEEEVSSIESALQSGDYVATPGGLFHKDCVSEIGDDEVFVQATGTLRSASTGAVRTVAPCTHEAFLGASAAREVTTAAAEHNGWVAASWWQAPRPLMRLTSTLTVPSTPEVVTGQLLYFFSSFQNDPVDSIVQPVLQFNYGGDRHWSYASWYVWGNRSLHTRPLIAHSGDKLTSLIDASSCNSAGGECNWKIQMKDTTRGSERTLNIWSSPPYRSAQGGVLEVYYLTSCRQLPANLKVTFDNVQVYGSRLAHLDPTFQPMYWDRICSARVSGGDTRTNISWQ